MNSILILVMYLNTTNVWCMEQRGIKRKKPTSDTREAYTEQKKKSKSPQPTAVDKELEKAITYFKEEKYDQAFEMYDILDHPRMPLRVRIQCWSYLSLIYNKKNDHEKAIALCKKIITSDATEKGELLIRAQHTLGGILLRKKDPKAEELLIHCARQDMNPLIKTEACATLCLLYYLRKNETAKGIPFAHMLTSLESNSDSEYNNSCFLTYCYLIKTHEALPEAAVFPDSKTELAVIEDCIMIYPNLSEKLRNDENHRIAYNEMISKRDALKENMH